MEARVDIRKLQLLNDRITQTIDALNQVRWSVHGLQHATGGVPSQGAYGPNPMQQTLPFGNQSVYGQPFAQQAFGPWQQGNPFAQSFAQQGFGISPLAQTNPYAQAAMNGIGIQHSTATPFGLPVMGYGAAMPLEIEQRVLEARAQDPYLLSRTFPQAFVPTMGW